jgi:hypothetical protein
MALICAFGTAPDQATDGYTLDTVVTGMDDELLAKYAEQDVRLVRGPAIAVMPGQYQFAVFRPSAVLVPEFTNRGKLKVLPNMKSIEMVDDVIGLKPGKVGNLHFEMLLDGTAIRGKEIIEALRDYLVNGMPLTDAWKKHDLNPSQFYRRLKVIQTESIRAQALSRYYKHSAESTYLADLKSKLALEAKNWLKEGNEEREKGDMEKAERCFELAQFCQDRADNVPENI